MDIYFIFLSFLCIFSTRFDHLYHYDLETLFNIEYAPKILGFKIFGASATLEQIIYSYDNYSLNSVLGSQYITLNKKYLVHGVYILLEKDILNTNKHIRI